MKRLMALWALSGVCAWSQAVFPPGNSGGGTGTGVANPHADIAGPATTSGVIDITALNLTTAALQNTLIAQCWTGTGFAASLVTGNLTPLTCSITSRSAAAVTVTFASSSNVLIVLNSNGGQGAAGAAGAAGATGPAGPNNNLLGTTITALQGTGTKPQMSTGVFVGGKCLQSDVNGNTSEAAGACGTGGAAVVYVSTFTGTGAFTLAATTHNVGIHPALTFSDSTGTRVDVPFTCKTAGGAVVGCEATSSNGDVAIGTVLSDTYTYSVR